MVAATPESPNHSFIEGVTMLGYQAARSLCLLVLGIVSSGALASPGDCTPPEFMTRADIPGLGMAKVQGQEIGVELYGFAKAPVACITDETVFEAASLTKPLVAYLVMRLVDQGRLDLNDVLTERLPSLPLPKDDPRTGTVTLGMALAHSTGLDGSDDQELRFVSEPGETFRYYPAGYRLVQRIVEHIEGDTLEAIAQREVFEPLGMRNSSLIFRKDLLGRIATRHRMLGDAIHRDRDSTRPANAAVSLITTPRDYGVFLRAMMNGEGLSEQSRRAMFTPQVMVPETDGRVAWGIGWGLEPDRGTFFHYGDDGAAKSFVIGLTKGDRAIVYFANSFYGMAIAGEIAERLIPGDSPAVEWLGYASWNAPRRLVRRDTLRAFVTGDADLGMETFRQYERDYPDLDMDGTAAFLQWILEGRSMHEGRARVLAWQLEREPENVDHHLNLARAQRALGDVPSAMETLQNARSISDETITLWIDAQLSWLQDEQLARQSEGDEPAFGTTELAGDYGTWRVFSDDYSLLFQAGEGRTYTLRWMHGTTYAFEEIDWFRIRFVVTEGQASSVIGFYSDGRTDESIRSNE
jgi:CubicO group peptidase (beta-lactamase class C family)